MTTSRSSREDPGGGSTRSGGGSESGGSAGGGGRGPDGGTNGFSSDDAGVSTGGGAVLRSATRRDYAPRWAGATARGRCRGAAPDGPGRTAAPSPRRVPRRAERTVHATDSRLRPAR